MVVVLVIHKRNLFNASPLTFLLPFYFPLFPLSLPVWSLVLNNYIF